MTAEEYLEQIHALEVKIEQRSEELRAIEKKCEEAQTAAGAKKSGKKKQQDDIEKIKAECETMIKDMTIRKHEIIGIIHRMKNTDHIQVLEMRYIKRLTMEQIASIMNTSPRQVYRYRDAAFIEFEKLVIECQPDTMI